MADRQPHSEPAAASHVVEQDRPPPGRTLAAGDVEDEVPRAAGREGEMDGVHARLRVDDGQPDPGERPLQPVDQPGPVAAHDERERRVGHLSLIHI